MPITILDYVKSRAGEKDTYTPEDFYGNGVEMLGGCEHCHATIAAYNAYPSKSGYWRCAECIGNHGFTTVENFIKYEADAGRMSFDAAMTQAEELEDSYDAYDPEDIPVSWCPICDSAEDIRKTGDRTFECPDCGTEYSL